MKQQLNIRAHHIPCITRFFRGGYNQKFAKNMGRICKIIRANPSIKIKVLIGKFDDICAKCPYKSKVKCTQSKEIEKWVVFQDKKIAKHLNLKPNSLHTAKELFNLSMKKINHKNIKSVCKNCIFLNSCVKFGVNNSFRKDLV